MSRRNIFLIENDCVIVCQLFISVVKKTFEYQKPGPEAGLLRAGGPPSDSPESPGRWPSEGGPHLGHLLPLPGLVRLGCLYLTVLMCNVLYYLKRDNSLKDRRRKINK